MQFSFKKNNLYQLELNEKKWNHIIYSKTNTFTGIKRNIAELIF